MSTELAIRSMDDLARVAEMFARSGLFKDTADAAQAGVKIMAGQAWGIDAFSSMVGIALIQGKPVIGAGIMAAKVKGHPKYDFIVNRLDESACEIEFFQGERSLGVSSFTIEDAKQAGYANKQNYRATPRNMLFARALSNGVRWFTPDVFSSSVYTPEDFNQEGEIDVEVMAPRAEKPHKPAGPALEAPAPEPEPEAQEEAPEPAWDHTEPASDEQKIAILNEMKKAAVPPKTRMPLLRWLLKRPLKRIDEMTAGEADVFIEMVADGNLEDVLADYAVATAEPPEES